MKKQFFGIAALVACCSLNSANAQTMFGGVAGLNISTISAKAGGQSYSPGMSIGFHVGPTASIGLSEHFALMPAILFSLKGAKIDEDQTDPLFGTTHVEASTTFNYLEVPVNVAYMFGAEGGGRFFVYAGPYLGYCFGGKTKEDITYPNGGPSLSIEQSLEVGNDMTQDHVRPLDYGVNAGVGYLLPMGLFFRAQYGLGLANTVPEGNSDNYTKNRVIGVSVGFLFGGGGGARYRF